MGNGEALSRRAFVRSAAALGVATAGLAAGAIPAHGAAVPQAADWMSELDQAMPLSRISLPGTHGSGARYGGALVINQDLTITEQLAAGARFLDVRCRAIDGVFAIHHDRFFQEIMFGDVLNDCQAFLSAHSRETVLMRVKQEYSTAPDTEFGAIFADYRRQWPNLFYTESRIPRLAESQGKVVVLADNGGVPGIRWNSPLLDISDDYDIGTIWEQESRKWPGVRAHFESARTTPPAEKAYITFTSSSGWALWPRDADTNIWPWVTDYLNGLDVTAKPIIGVVAMDFTTAAKAEQVYRLNFG
ncbi:1-phosphatidylinositol phosphodiesterase [Herbihabitans rhizosphaerae]|uniref:1-phosphatidylinositol phosphodiesterase n=1 Tax=Herbihabitans rhizosphaerae TaxID=1872711 RepID=A0A4Q7L432_9PSEU|nr:phosphatidylinositol-specific phospholipase C [Herbihabitans rhizosphaerae]RZS43530.1 1-phosphatidylinositol phosphodiesterase [Herbihabitans rhizosphaerae]